MSIYLDYAAATPLSPEIARLMENVAEVYGNPSSIHSEGRKARLLIDEARSKCMAALGAFSPHEIIFTGSGTESCNMAIFGAAFARREKGNHIIISGLEHPAVSEAARHLAENFGFELSVVNPDAEGKINPHDVKALLRKDTILLSVMLANNETGVIQPIKQLARMARKNGTLFHTDACQAPGALSVNVQHSQVDLMSLNGTKIYGPKGVGLLYIRQGVNLMPHIFGGGQEFRIRGGTENTMNIVGFAEALKIAVESGKRESARAKKMRDTFLESVLKLKGVSLNGALEPRLPGNVNLHVKGILGETLVMRLDMEGISVSSGSACASGKTEASKVLLAMGQSEKMALESLRISFGRYTQMEDLNKLAALLKLLLPELRKIQKL